MTKLLEKFNQAQLKKDLPGIRPGDTIRVYQKIRESLKKSKTSKGREDKDLPAGRQGRIQVFEGLVLARKHGKGISSTITVRKVISGIGVERIFPLHSSMIEKIEIVKRGRVRRAKLYYLRKAKGRKARLKKVDFEQSVIQETKESAQEETEEKPAEEKVGEKKEEKTEK